MARCEAPLAAVLNVGLAAGCPSPMPRWRFGKALPPKKRPEFPEKVPIVGSPSGQGCIRSEKFSLYFAGALCCQRLGEVADSHLFGPAGWPMGYHAPRTEICLGQETVCGELELRCQ